MTTAETATKAARLPSIVPEYGVPSCDEHLTVPAPRALTSP
jgi:hypothetical protein